MKNRKSLSYAVFTIVLFAALILSSLVFAACGATKYSITWEYENATIAVDGYSELPSEATADSTVTFTVTAANGYKVSSVVQDGVAINKTGDKYSFVVTEDTKITITTVKEIASISVVTNPTKLNYFHGESLDKTGMKVQVNYKTGDPQIIDGSDANIKIAPGMFIAGDSSFTVTYNDITSAAVQLAATVEYLVTLDPNGATLSKAAAEKYKDQHNYTYDETTGIVSFSYYNNIPEAGIALPVEADLTLENYTFYGWREAGASTIYEKIDQDTRNLNLKATWEAQLVNVTRAYFDKRTEGGKDIAYLVLDGQFMAATSASLYLYEGNDDIELEGPGVTGTKGETFELLFNLEDLAKARTSSGSTYEGKWMDIRFKASLGTRVEEQEIYVADVDVNTSSVMANAAYTYGFQTYASNLNGKSALKVYYNEKHVEYSMEFKTVNNNPTLVVSGSVYNEDYFGKTMMISWWQGSSETAGDFGVINAAGQWTININLTQFAYDNIAYAHIGVVESAQNTSAIWGGTSNNLIRSDCTTSFANVPTPDRVGGIRVALKSGDDNFFTDATGSKYHVGCTATSSSSGIVLYAQAGVSVNATSLELKTSDSKAFIEIKGTYTGDVNILSNLVLDFQKVDEWGYTYFPIGELATLVANGGEFTFTANITALGAGTQIMHFGIGQGGGNLFVSSSSGSITVGGTVYTIVPHHSNWNVSGVLVAAA